MSALGQKRTLSNSPISVHGLHASSGHNHHHRCPAILDVGSRLRRGRRVGVQSHFHDPRRSSINAMPRTIPIRSVQSSPTLPREGGREMHPVLRVISPVAFLQRPGVKLHRQAEFDSCDGSSLASVTGNQQKIKPPEDVMLWGFTVI